MDLNTATQAIRAKVGDNCGLGATLKFDCGEEGVVFVDAVVVPNRVGNVDADAACTVKLSLATLADLLSGELQATTGFMTGRFKVHGDMSIAMKLQRVL